MLTISLTYLLSVAIYPAVAKTQNDITSFIRRTPFYDPTCSATSTTSTAKPGIYVIGDSLTVGMRDNGSLGSKLTNKGWEVKEIEATNAFDITDSLPKIQEDSDKIRESETIVIALGTNPEVNFGDKVTEIIETVRGIKQSIDIKWMNVYVLDGAYIDPSFAGNDAINRTLQTKSSELNFSVIDWASEARASTATYEFLGDGVHHSPSGSTKRAEWLVNTIGSAPASARGSAARNTSTPTSTPVNNFNPDPAAVAMFENDLKPLIEPLVPLYQKAAQEAGLADWEILPALHNLEFGLRRDNPTTNTGFRTPFQMNARSLASHGLNLDDPVFTPGHELTDDEFVLAAKYAAQYWLIPDGNYFGIDATKNVSPEEAAKMIVAYKSGAGSVWFTGAADFNLHAYAWAGYDSTPEHKLPMDWGPGSPYGDEQPGDLVNKPGAATVFALLKGGDFGSPSNECEELSKRNDGFSPISGTKEEIIQRILANTQIGWGNAPRISSEEEQKQDVQDCLTDNTLKGLLAMAEQSGVRIPINTMARGHGGCTRSTTGSDHLRGEAIDIGYYGNGKPNFVEEGNTLYKYLYDNRQALNVDQMIWQEPPSGYQCTDDGGPVDCYAFYGSSTMNDHYHHIHVSFK